MPTYYNQTAIERFIAIGRLALAAVSLVAIYLDPKEPSRYEAIAYTCLALYLAYATVVFFLVWPKPSSPSYLPGATYFADLAAFGVLIYFSEGPTSPFFLFVVFLIVCANMRWSWPLALVNGLLAVVVFLAIGVFTAYVLKDTTIELDRFVIRSGYLTVLAVLLGYLGRHRRRVQEQILGLTAWPVAIAEDASRFVGRLLENSATALRAPRVIMVAQEQATGTLELATWVRGEFHWLAEAEVDYQRLVAGPLADKSFLCADVSGALPRVLYNGAAGLETWRGAPINGGFQALFDIKSAVLSCPLPGSALSGRLFFLDEPSFNSDDLVLSEIVSQMIATRMDNYYLSKQSRRAAAAELRVQMSHHLHDSVLQFLAAMSLQLEAIRRLMEASPDSAREISVDMQHLLSEEQKRLRAVLEDLKNPSSDTTGRSDAGTRP